MKLAAKDSTVPTTVAGDKFLMRTTFAAGDGLRETQSTERTPELIAHPIRQGREKPTRSIAYWHRIELVREIPQLDENGVDREPCLSAMISDTHLDRFWGQVRVATLALTRPPLCSEITRQEGETRKEITLFQHPAGPNMGSDG
jgi:hypothetical protein